MPQLVPFFFISQVVFAFAIFVILVFMFTKYILPRFVRLFARRISINRLNIMYYNISSLIRFRILIVLSIYAIIIPIKVMFSISGILNISLIIGIATILLSKFFLSLYKNNSLPTLHSIFSSILMYIFIYIFIYTLAYWILDFLYLIDSINLADIFFTFFVCIYEEELILSEGSHMTKRTPEVTEKLRAKRAKATKLDYYCIRAYGNFMDEKNLSKKNENLKKLFKLVGRLRDVKTSIDLLADNNRSASQAFHKKDYAIFVSKVIKEYINKK